MTRSERKRKWGAVIGRFEASGLSRRRFCEREGIATSTFDYWRRKGAGDAATTSPFVELTSAMSAPTLRADEAEIVFPGGTRLKIGARFPLRTIQRLAKTLAC